MDAIKSMKFSFILPVYKKSQEQLRKAIASLFDQSYKNVEVICVFDGSNPELEAVAKEFPLVKSKVIEHAGACAARNAGVELATGDYLSFWDCDSYAVPEMVTMWKYTFDRNPDCDFVYSGYNWTNPAVEGFQSEPFDAWRLSKYNYIASMFPLKRDKFPGWDESLSGLQDWDYWRRVVENGSKGRFIPGFGFSTDLPDKDSISGQEDKNEARIKAVRLKHGDYARDIVVHGMVYNRYASIYARILDADFFPNRFWNIDKYKLAIMFGFHPGEMEAGGSFLKDSHKDTKRVIYWMGMDAESFFTAPYWQVVKLREDMKTQIDHHFCNDERTKDILSQMDIKAQIVSLPRQEETSSIEFPAKFKVLALVDKVHEQMFREIAKALPMIQMDIVKPETYYNIMDYSLGIQYLSNPRLDANSQSMLLKGRHLISNVEAPMVDTIQIIDDVTAFKNQFINKILEIQKDNKPYLEAREYYMTQSSPARFRDEIMKLIPNQVTLEVI